MNYILNGAQIENMATQLNKANRTAIRQCECEKIAAENKWLREALEIIEDEFGGCQNFDGCGTNRPMMEHCAFCIAAKALERKA